MGHQGGLPWMDGQGDPQSHPLDSLDVRSTVAVIYRPGPPLIQPLHHFPPSPPLFLVSHTLAMIPPSKLGTSAPSSTTSNHTNRFSPILFLKRKW